MAADSTTDDKRIPRPSSPRLQTPNTWENYRSEAFKWTDRGDEQAEGTDWARKKQQQQQQHHTAAASPPTATSHTSTEVTRTHTHTHSRELYLHLLPTPRGPHLFLSLPSASPLSGPPNHLLDTLTIFAASFRRPWWLKRSGGIPGGSGSSNSAQSSLRCIASSASRRAVTMISSIRVIHPPAASSNPTPHPLVVLTVGTNKYVFNAPEGTVRTLTQRRAPLGGKGELNVFVSDVCEATRGLPGAYVDGSTSRAWYEPTDMPLRCIGFP